MDAILASIIALGTLGTLILVVSGALTLICYIVESLGYMKVLKRLGYKNVWIAWIPNVQYYALADVVAQGQEKINIIGSLSVPVIVYKLWWIVTFLPYFVSDLGWISLIVQIIFLGHSFIKLFAIIDNKAEQDEKVIGYVSGFIPLIGAIKFLIAK